MIRFGILGPIELYDGGRRTEVGGTRQAGLLAFLLLHPNQAVSAERLMDALWGEQAAAHARKPLQMAIARLRATLERAGLRPADRRLQTVSGGYLLSVGADELDLTIFEQRAQEGRRAMDAGEPAAASEVLSSALALWRGAPLADVAYEPFAQAEIRRLEELRLVAIETRIAADLQLHGGAAVIGELEALVAEHPTRERSAEALMVALYRSGRHAEALDAFQRLRHRLATELGLEPGPALQQLQTRILRHDPGLVEDEAPASRAAPPVQSRSLSLSLPRDRRAITPPPTVTVGRDTDLERLERLVARPDVQLVTLVGPGGVGKTRLALELARSAHGSSGDGCMVFLADVRAAEHVASAIAVELGVTTSATEPTEPALLRHLASREMLLILDNLEHLLDATPLIARIAQAAPSVTIVVTSREPLRLRGERTFPVDPLALPPLQADPLDPAAIEAPAIALFLNAATNADPSFAPTAENSAAVVALCRRLDGLPLALELAAGRVTLLSPAEILRRLDHDQSVLGRGPRDAPARHRTLETTLRWSFDLLSDAEQAALAWLSVFAGGCAVTAAERVTSAPLDVLHSLVDKHMLVKGTDRFGEPRVFMLETIRQFARERLDDRGEHEAAAHRHFDCYLALAEEVRPQLERTGAPTLVARMAGELENIRAALGWAISRGRADDALRLVLALQPYWCLRAELEGVRWMRSALAEEHDNVSAEVLARALTWHGVTLAEEADFAEAESVMRRSVEMQRECGDLRGLAEALTSLAKIILLQNRPADGLVAAKGAVAAAEETGEPILLARALAWQASAEPTLPLALSVGDRAASLYTAAGNIARLVDLKSKLSYIAISHGDYTQALRLAQQALDAAHESGIIETFAQGNLGLAALLSGDPQLAARAFHAEIAAARAEPLLYPLHEALRGLAAISALEGDPLRAATLLGAVDTLRTHELAPVITAELERRFYAPARTHAALPEWETAYDAGRRLSLDDALEAAVSVAA
jgi:predicted ATPase/DNA-binding SARP family transcriptional activator